MKSSKWVIFCIAFGLMAGTAGALSWTRANQRLGRPGILATPIPGIVMMKIDLPEHVLDFTSTNVPEPQVVLGYLPPDSSYAERLYSAPDGLQVTATIVLMGGDRTSIHKPDYCLPGQGWTIRSRKTASLAIAGATPYELPVSEWVISNSLQTPDGRTEAVSGVYIFWFVADGE